ncbi:hypothetical protein [Saccharomonospora piscinae]|uniref:hypothetical protein n=1 Tax=Saccharomonospora piscinae TaxID=687388 RepID=UPI0004672256|nr:hypothetical protein [Saccharomonospora piscinae]
MTTWTVELLVRTPDTTLDNDTLLELTETAEQEHDWTVARWELGDGFWVNAESEAGTATAATAVTYDDVAAWLRTLDLRTSVASVRAVDLEVYELEVDQPTVPELVSAVEAAEILQVSRQRVHELAKSRPDFPAPLYELRTGPLWKRDAIESFDRRWVRRPGRPRIKARAKDEEDPPDNVAPLRPAKTRLAANDWNAELRYQQRG